MTARSLFPISLCALFLAVSLPSQGADDAWLEGSPAQRKRLEKLEKGPTPPALQVTEWLNSEALSLDKLKGKVVVLDFWATWCGPCIASIPHNNEMAEKYKDQGLVLIGVCHPRGGDKMKQVAKDKGIRYPLALDPNSKTISAYEVNGYPDYYIIGKDGRLAVADCKNSQVEDAVKKLLAE